MGKGYVETMRDLKGYFRQGDRLKMYSACTNLRDKLLIRVLWKTGRRIGEVLQLKVNDIDFDEKEIIWNIEKKKRPLRRVKPIDDFTCRLLKRYINSGNFKYDDYVFKSSYKEGKPITRQRAFQIIRTISERAGVKFVGNKKPHPHHFRHSFAIDIVRKSKNPGDIKKLKLFLEHSSLEVTQHYLQFSNEDLRELIED